jgi:hypothetical protein
MHSEPRPFTRGPDDGGDDEPRHWRRRTFMRMTHLGIPIAIALVAAACHHARPPGRRIDRTMS